MPDWFYRPVTRPILWRLSATRGRDFALGFMGRLARLPLGPRVIDLLGHMAPDPRLAVTVAGIRFPSRLGLGPYLDSRAVALPALGRFGFGFLDVGPIVASGDSDDGGLERRPDEPAIRYRERPTLGLATAVIRLAEVARAGPPVVARLGYRPGVPLAAESAATLTMIEALAPHVAAFALAPEPLDGAIDSWQRHVAGIVAALRALDPPRPLLVCVAVDASESDHACIDAAIAAGVAGVIVDGAMRSADGGFIVGAANARQATAQVARVRQRHGSAVAIIAGGGVHDPQQALDLRGAGADLVEADVGLAYAGPGLAKRINEALLYREVGSKSPAPPIRAVEASWFWLLLMGAGMLVGSVLAMVIAATRTVLPYDEHFVGLTRAEVHAVNPRLLAFMTHDRVSLAGTMIAIGVLYAGLSWFGVRRGQHWARTAIVASAASGFLSFFLFLGYGYLDPLHAFVTVVLLQLLLFGVHGRVDERLPTAPPTREDRAWRRSTWGQLLMIGHALALLVAGVAISGIGIGHVFVATDLEFMQTTAAHLHAASPFLVPLVAHDRATLGGMLIASGVGLLLTALWGFQHDARWLWWTFVVAGAGAYGGIIAVHLAVGYTAFEHLVPAFAGLAIYVAALALSREFLCSTRG